MALKDYKAIDIKPPGPGGPITVPGVSIRSGNVVQGQVNLTYKDLDPARYIAKPDIDFKRPWLANDKNGSAFVWPLGIEGFDLSSDATLGIHKYIGDNDVDATIVYPDELHINMSGLFPGYTGVQNMVALRQVILERPNNGKILALPLVLNELRYVKVMNHRFTHSNDDRTRGIAYSIDFLVVGIGSSNPVSDPAKGTRPQPKKNNSAPKGKSAKTVTTTQNHRTLKTVSAEAYGTPDLWTSVRDLNIIALNNLNISAFTLPYAELPIGLELTV
jgi:hypothetical protein